MWRLSCPPSGVFAVASSYTHLVRLLPNIKETLAKDVQKIKKWILLYHNVPSFKSRIAALESFLSSPRLVSNVSSRQISLQHCLLYYSTSPNVFTAINVMRHAIAFLLLEYDASQAYVCASEASIFIELLLLRACRFKTLQCQDRSQAVCGQTVSARTSFSGTSSRCPS